MSGVTLTIEFCGAVHRLEGGDLTFGRRGDLVIDENPFLHRIAGRFVLREGLWWLQNHSKRMAFVVRDLDARSRVEVAPGDQAVLTLPEFEVRLRAGPTEYAINGCLSGTPAVAAVEADAHGTATVDFGVVPLTADQHLLLVALCETRLAGGDGLPTNAAVARRLGWSMAKFNRKLDNLCLKLARQGVKGLHGAQGALATDRRAALVSHSLGSGLVSAADVSLLGNERGPEGEAAAGSW